MSVLIPPHLNEIHTVTVNSLVSMASCQALELLRVPSPGELLQICSEINSAIRCLQRWIVSY